jgi:hypothetical protein
MIRHIYISMTLGFILMAIPLHAANRPHAGADRQTIKVWTNDDLEKLNHSGLISIVGRDDETSTPIESSKETRITQDPVWYAEQAARLRDELQHRQAQLRDYQQALDNARNHSGSTGGVDLVDEDFAITPEAGIEILQQRVSETQSELDALEDLARRNDIEPGTLRGR